MPQPTGVGREDMNQKEWKPFEVFSDRGSAEALVAVLGSEGVPARVESSELVAGIEARYRVLVPSSLVHRARWVLADSDLTESELDYLATGKLSDAE
jgi:hypothetical protein